MELVKSELDLGEDKYGEREGDKDLNDMPTLCTNGMSCLISRAQCKMRMPEPLFKSLSTTRQWQRSITISAGRLQAQGPVQPHRLHALEAGPGYE